MYVRINGVPVGIWGPEAVMFIGRKIVHAIGASKGWAGQGSGSGTWLGERGRQSSQRGRQRQRKTGRAVGVGVLRNQTSHVCGDQRCKHEIPRRGAGAGSNSLPCRDMGCDPSDAGAYMCLADIAAEGRVPDVRTHMHACFETFWLDWHRWTGLWTWSRHFGERPASDESSGPLGYRGRLEPYPTAAAGGGVCVSREGRDQLLVSQYPMCGAARIWDQDEPNARWVPGSQCRDNAKPSINMRSRSGNQDLAGLI